MPHGGYVMLMVASCPLCRTDFQVEDYSIFYLALGFGKLYCKSCKEEVQCVNVFVCNLESKNHKYCDECRFRFACLTELDKHYEE